MNNNQKARNEIIKKAIEELRKNCVMTDNNKSNLIDDAYDSFGDSPNLINIGDC